MYILTLLKCTWTYCNYMSVLCTCTLLHVYNIICSIVQSMYMYMYLNWSHVITLALLQCTSTCTCLYSLHVHVLHYHMKKEYINCNYACTMYMYLLFMDFLPYCIRTLYMLHVICLTIFMWWIFIIPAELICTVYYNILYYSYIHVHVHVYMYLVPAENKKQCIYIYMYMDMYNSQ